MEGACPLGRLPGRLRRPGPTPRLAGASCFLKPLQSRRADPAANAAPRTPRRGRRADGAVRRLGDARPVRGRHPGAPSCAHRLRRLRRLAHGPVPRRRPERPPVASVAALERPRQARRGRRAVHAADERARGHRRRPDRLPDRSAPLSPRRQRGQPRPRVCVAEGTRDPRLRGARRVRRVRAPRRAGAESRSSGSACPRRSRSPTRWARSTASR